MASNSNGNGSSPYSPNYRGAVRDLTRDSSDEQMDQVRDLLFGDLRRTWDARLQALETRLETLESKFEALTYNVTTERRAEMSTLAEGVDELSRHIRRLTKG
jgi:polyhydroxyalkanoate synthesis regulator phasin